VMERIARRERGAPEVRLRSGSPQNVASLRFN
jgi:hypothetical protein